MSGLSVLPGAAVALPDSRLGQPVAAWCVGGRGVDGPQDSLIADRVV